MEPSKIPSLSFSFVGGRHRQGGNSIEWIMKLIAVYVALICSIVVFTTYISNNYTQKNEVQESGDNRVLHDPHIRRTHTLHPIAYPNIHHRQPISCQTEATTAGLSLCKHVKIALKR